MNEIESFDLEYCLDKYSIKFTTKCENALNLIIFFNHRDTENAESYDKFTKNHFSFFSTDSAAADFVCDCGAGNCL